MKTFWNKENEGEKQNKKLLYVVKNKNSKAIYIYKINLENLEKRLSE